MKVASRFTLLATLVVTAGLTGLAPAKAITFDFSSPTGLLGNSQAYGLVTATGFTSNTFTTQTALFGKNDGGDEKGVGLNNDLSGDHEISGSNLIRVAVPAGLTNIMFQMGSTTNGEGWQVFGSNSATSGYVSVFTGSDELTHLLPLESFYYFIATGGVHNNVLLASMSATPTPLPAALPLMGSVLGAGYLVTRWRKRRGPHGSDAEMSS